jgi:Uma2 family endonuclease
MRATLRLDRQATYADYLAVEEHSQHRHELIDGVIVAMAGGSPEHNAIAGRFAMLFATRLEGECRYYTPDQRYWIPANGRSRYADGSILCGKPERPGHDDQAASNPAVLLEVLSPSSEGDDEGDKRRDFQSLPSLRAYVVAHQDQRCVKVYRRGDAGAWPSEPEVYLTGQDFELPTLSRPCSVADVYDTVLDQHGRSLLR